MMSLEKSGLFWNCNLPVTDMEFSKCKTLSIEKNTTMYFSSEQMEYIYYLNNGVVSFNLSFFNKVKKIYWKCKSLINSFLLFTDDYRFQLQTITDVDFKIMNINDFKRKIKSNREFLLEVIMYNAYSYYCYINQLSLMCFYDSHAKIDQFFKSVHEYDNITHFTEFIAGGYLTQRNIAEALSLHPVTISKVVKKMETATSNRLTN